MATPVIMPKQGQSVESCIITEWYKNKGEKVSKGDVLFSYETDKASFEEEAKENGILLDRFFEDGDEVPVLTNVAVIGEEGESAEPYHPDNNQDKSGSSDEKEPDQSGISVAAEKAQKTKETEKTTSQQPAAEQNKQDPEKTATPEKTPESIKLRDKSMNSEATDIDSKEADVSFSDSGKKIKISPRAKRLAETKGIHFSKLKGTGPEGRIIERDVQKAIEGGGRVSPKAKEAMQEEALTYEGEGTGLAGAINYDDLKATNQIYGEDYEDVKLSNIRKLIARSMHVSLQNSAQLTHHLSADARNILSLRKKVKSWQQEESLSINVTLNDMIVYATIRAIKNHPASNVHFLGDTIRHFKKVHMGFAVDTERGLMVPVIKNADDLSLTGLSSQLKSLAEACKKGSIDPDLLASTAGSFTISNLGNYGVEMFTPILNVPQACILGVNTIIQRPAQMSDGTFGFVPYLGLSLTYDHRAIDGGPATKFLADIKNEIENFNGEKLRE